MAGFLARRAVDGFVESEAAVLRALAGPRAKREPGWAEMLLHGYCDYNRRNKKGVQPRLAALEKVSPQSAHPEKRVSPWH
jgi:hypothetical protein